MYEWHHSAAPHTRRPHLGLCRSAVSACACTRTWHRNASVRQCHAMPRALAEASSSPPALCTLAGCMHSQDTYTIFCHVGHWSWCNPAPWVGQACFFQDHERYMSCDGARYAVTLHSLPEFWSVPHAIHLSKPVTLKAVHFGHLAPGTLCASLQRTGGGAPDSGRLSARPFPHATCATGIR